MTFARFIAPLALLLVPAVAFAGNGDYTPAPENPTVWGGDETEPCAWPSVVMVTGGGNLCSATFIHPKVVMYAAHCGYQDKVVRFGDSDASGKTVQVEYCKTYPGYNGSQSTDWAYCVLQNEVTDIPFTPVGYGCEVNQYVAHGADIAIVGFGNNSGQTGAGRKRWAFTKMWNPGPYTFDIGGNGYPTICSGDSGGPVFIRYDDGTWHAYGIASTKNSDTCDQAAGTHSLATNAAKWIENDSGIDVTVCHDNDGNWDPGPLCGGFFNGEPALSYGSWYTWCEDVTRSGWSGTCGPDYGNNAESVPPTVAIVSPTDGAAYEESPTTLDITIDVADTSGFWDVQIEIAGMLQPVVISDQSPTVFSGVNFTTGEYTLVAHATDFWGNQAVSEPVTITVTNGPVGEDEGESTDEGESGGEGEADEGESTGDGGLDEVGDTYFDPSASGDGGSCAVVESSGDAGGLALLGLGLLGLAARRRRD